MSSVEELCDNITLINKAPHNPGGSVNKIRSEWGGNEFDVTLRGDVSPGRNDLFSVLNQQSENSSS